MHQKVLQPFCTHMHVHPISPSFFFGRWNTVRTKGPVFPGGSFLPRLSRSPIGILWPAMDVRHWTHSNGGSPACPWTTSHLTTPNFYIWLEEIRDILGLTNQPTNQPSPIFEKKMSWPKFWPKLGPKWGFWPISRKTSAIVENDERNHCWKF